MPSLTRRRTVSAWRVVDLALHLVSPPQQHIGPVEQVVPETLVGLVLGGRAHLEGWVGGQGVCDGAVDPVAGRSPRSGARGVRDGSPTTR